ncbi:hypothetical protein PSYJA_43206, partial [Pseudomonas syringae pv. japonica str. M301072]
PPLRSKLIGASLARISDVPISDSVYGINFKAEKYIRSQISLIDER